MNVRGALLIASRTISYELRCWLCEVLVSWSLKISPPGYVPSYVEAVVKLSYGAIFAVRTNKTDREREIEHQIAEIGAKHKRAFEEEIAPLLSELALVHT